MSRFGRFCAFLCMATILMLSAAGTAAAQANCHVEPMPAATLLLPYFEVDLDNPNGVNTLLSVNNFSASPVVANAVFRTDLGVFVFIMPIYLKGYDVQTINLRDVLVNDVWPQTSGSYPGCAGVLPPGNPSYGTLWSYQQAFTGQAVPLFGYACAGRNLGDRVARGYVTVDAMNNCTPATQLASGYFAGGGTGQASNRNVLWGDYYYENPALNQAEGHPMVHINADATNPAYSTPGRYSFYGKYDSWSAVDNRVPLATNFAVRYFNNYPFTSDLVVWRDNKVGFTGSFTCGNVPSWYPLGQTTITAWDEDSHSATVTTNAFPAVAQRVHVGSDLPVPFSFGWLFLDLNTTVPAAGPNPPVDSRAAQAWVTASMVRGAEALGVDAIRIDTACAARHSGL